ncbi:ATP-binding cassette domain-containing protein [Flavobacterium sp. ANB]|uniref:ABC transporter ATP-binding protein n=1 Tax=unclassified Flavobacterium TaxID=196869 RepID=UPI0012BA0D08|nr:MULTISPECIES: ATP-binding cassette domain-containing protein [unclassified Flavobacterium]MBF4516655.1 ATP-binding cassette domain-containing protein [Flavobacterium sp. ANB]MTD69449.1 ATP-binding cassette domain-containing protein [Flavobacterium sp. LC2016-13]
MIKEEKNIEKEPKVKSKAPIIEIKNLHKTFGKNNKILKGVNLTVNQGEDLVILGRSGSGKSVTIKCIVGLIEPDKGEIKVFDENVLNLKKSELNEIRVRIGFLFQSGALYDSMSVRENLAFTLKKHKRDLTPEEVEAEVVEALDNVGLSDAINKMPSELSGGMQKRIGLARTLILKPEIILYDEPTTGLDTITSREISELILDIKHKRKTTSIIITHDMACAKLTADRIMVLKDGVIHAEGTYEELEESEDEWVRSFFE